MVLQRRRFAGRVLLGRRGGGGCRGGFGYFLRRSFWRRCTRAVATRCMADARSRRAACSLRMHVVMVVVKEVVSLWRMGASMLFRIRSLVILIL